MVMIKIGVAGGAGRMGKAIVAEIARNPRCELVGVTVLEQDPNRGRDAGEVAGIGRLNVPLRHTPVEMFENADVVIDFTSPAASLEHCMLAHEYKTALVIGTTGFNPKQNEMLKSHAEKVPLLGAPNMSLGVNLLQALTTVAARILDDRFDAEILEMHHNAKRDAPSGTALALGESVAKGRGVRLSEKAAHDRSGQRDIGDIGFAVLRGGDVVGDHTVFFAGPGERIELSHRASSRVIYAHGAVHAALWIADKPAGLYTMQDVLNLGL